MVTGHVVHVPVVKGDFNHLPANVKEFIATYVRTPYAV